MTLSFFFGRGGGERERGGGNLPPTKLVNFTGGGDNLARHCFVSRDLIPVSFSK